MTDLDEGGQELGDIALVGLQVALHEGVEVEKQQLVHADDPGHQGHDRHARLKLLSGALLQPCKEFLRKCLHAAAHTEEHSFSAHLSDD